MKDVDPGSHNTHRWMSDKSLYLYALSLSSELKTPDPSHLWLLTRKDLIATGPLIQCADS